MHEIFFLPTLMRNYSLEHKRNVCANSILHLINLNYNRQLIHRTMFQYKIIQSTYIHMYYN